jgi:hypothetical protein
MPDNGVTHKELNSALGKQTAVIIATLRRSEDKVDDKIDKVSDRVTAVERRNRWETFFTAIATFISAVLFGKFTGGSG